MPAASTAPVVAGVRQIDHVLTARQVDGMLDVWHRFPQYRVVGTAPSRVERPVTHRPVGPVVRFARGLSSRADLAASQTRGGADPLAGARQRYFRETYADGGEPDLVGIEPFLSHPNLVDAAGELWGATRILPWYVYANILLPGQELGAHTDIPEFRGVSRGQAPAWMLVVMRHSGLFERWRIPVATAIWYPFDQAGGIFRSFAGADSVAVAPTANRAVLLDADTVYHGVDRVPGDESALAGAAPGARLLRMDHRSWVLLDAHGAGARTLAEYRSDEIRYSASWKALCFRDQDDYDRWADGTDDLAPASVVPRLRAELEVRGRLAPGEPVSEEELGRRLIDEFVAVPG